MCDSTNTQDDLQPDAGVKLEPPTEIVSQDPATVTTQPPLNIPALWGNITGFFCSVANTVGSMASSVFHSNDISNASCMDTHEKNAECLRNMANDPTFTPEQQMENAHQAVAEGEKKDQKDSENKRFNLEATGAIGALLIGILTVIPNIVDAFKRNKQDL